MTVVFLVFPTKNSCCPKKPVLYSSLCLHGNSEWKSLVEISKEMNLAENEKNFNMEAIKYRNLIEYLKDFKLM